MEDPGTPGDIQNRMRPITLLSDDEARQLHQLLQGVHAAAERMKALAPVFPAEVDASHMSTDVDGSSLKPYSEESSG